MDTRLKSQVCDIQCTILHNISTSKSCLNFTSPHSTVQAYHLNNTPSPSTLTPAYKSASSTILPEAIINHRDSLIFIVYHSCINHHEILVVIVFCSYIKHYDCLIFHCPLCLKVLHERRSSRVLYTNRFSERCLFPLSTRSSSCRCLLY